MLTATSTVDIPDTSPQEVLEFVLDLERYREADHKITKVASVTGPDESGHGSAKLSGRLRFGPAAPDVQNFVLERWQRLTFTGAPGQPGRLVFNFEGTFDCAPSSAGTTVTHAYEFRFRGPFRILERFHRTWLQIELDAEMERVRVALSK